MKGEIERVTFEKDALAKKAKNLREDIDNQEELIAEEDDQKEAILRQNIDEVKRNTEVGFALEC